MRVALEELGIEGIKTNIELHYGILHDFDFVKEITTPPFRAKIKWRI